MAVNTVGFAAYGTRVSVDEVSGEIICDGVGDVKILQLSDVQTANLIECSMAYPTVKAVVEEARPDIIVLTGDNISNGSGHAVLEAFVSLMDSFEVPWAPVFGNHDPNSDVPMEEICDRLEASEYCLFKRGNLADRYGNYSYTLKQNGEALYSLIFMDSEKEGFTEEQVAWYESTVRRTAEKYGESVPSFVYYHIPIKETVAAHEAYARDPSIGTGVQRSEVRVQNTDSGFFDKVLELGSTTALFYGHDHENNTAINYRGVLFCYGTKTGVTVYYDKNSLGGNLITVKGDASFSLKRINK